MPHYVLAWLKVGRDSDRVDVIGLIKEIGRGPFPISVSSGLINLEPDGAETTNENEDRQFKQWTYSVPGCQVVMSCGALAR